MDNVEAALGLYIIPHLPDRLSSCWLWSRRRDSALTGAKAEATGPKALAALPASGIRPKANGLSIIRDTPTV